MKHLLLSLFLALSFQIQASYILIPMDAESQKNHLKAWLMLALWIHLKMFTELNISMSMEIIEVF